jgi:SAM-dependent methyltransferase
MRPPTQDDTAPAELDVRVLVLGLRELTDTVHERERLREVRERELAPQRAVDLHPSSGVTIEGNHDDHCAAAYPPRVEHREPGPFFDALWSSGDYWELETSEYDQGRFQAQVSLLDDRRYRRAIEYGCGGGEFTRRLAGIAESVLALDASPVAMARARPRLPQSVEIEVVDAGDFDPVVAGPFDLAVVCETIYYLGWLRSFFQIGWFAHRLLEAIEPAGRLLLGNTIVEDDRSLESPWLIRTYRDLFVNVGFVLEREERYQNVKGGVEFEALLSLFRRP